MGHHPPPEKHGSETYMKTGLDPLLAYAVKRVQETGEECTFERLVYECFTLFPKKFAFLRYPQWPDATRINKSWLRCRTDKGWIVGSVQEGFRLTSKGEEVARDVEKFLCGVARPTKIQAEQKPRGKEEAALRHIRGSIHFERWVNNSSEFAITLPEFLSLLNSTLETPRRVLRQNLHFYRQVAVQLNDIQVASFLDACAKQHENRLRESGSRKGG